MSGPYTVYLSSHKQEGSAKGRSVGKLDGKDMQAPRMVEVDLSPKGHWFRVCSGEFKTSAEALAQAWDMERAGVSPDPFLARRP